MERARFKPKAQVFVCTNVRGENDPLKSACGTHGPGVFEALRAEVRARGLGGAVWVTRSGCLGHCPRNGCSAVVQPAGEQLVEVTAGDAAALLLLALARS